MDASDSGSPIGSLVSRSYQWSATAISWFRPARSAGWRALLAP